MKNTYSKNWKKKKYKEIPEINDLLYANVLVLIEHGTVRYLASKDFLSTHKCLIYIDTVENVLENFSACSLISKGVPVTPGYGPTARKKFMALLSTMNINSDFEVWKIYRESAPVEATAESIAE